MASWYVSSVGYAAVAQFAINTAYSVGNIVRQLATPAVGSERCFRCTTAGTSAASEPSWNLTKGATTTSGTATFTEVTGNSTYNWSAPAARLLLMLNTFSAPGDTIYVAQNHAETQSTAITYSSTGTAAAPVYVYCVNAAGSVPPVAADLATTGTVSCTGATSITFSAYVYCRGLTFSAASGSSSGSLVLGGGASSMWVFDSCGLVLNTTSSSAQVTLASSARTFKLLNTTITFGAVGQTINPAAGRFIWKNTASAIGGTVPTTLFNGSTNDAGSVVCDGVDLSAAGSTKTLFGNWAGASELTIVNCKLNASVTVAASPAFRGSVAGNLIVSDSGATGYRQERSEYEGVLTAETTYVLTGGATDGVTPISWKVVTTANALPLFPFETFPIGAWNTTTGSSVTATIEIESNATLTNADIWVELETLDTSGNPISTLHSTAPATPLTTPTNLTTSSASWAGGLSGAVKQYIQTTFTPQLVGLVRGTVKVGKASQTVYINPQITLT